MNNFLACYRRHRHPQFSKLLSAVKRYLWHYGANCTERGDRGDVLGTFIAESGWPSATWPASDATNVRRRGVETFTPSLTDAVCPTLRGLATIAIMSDDEHDEPAKRSKRWAWAVAVPILYVLSVGPFCGALHWGIASGKMSEGVFNFLGWVYSTIYAPLLWLAFKVPVVEQAFRWYIGLFL
jgi:hypothetical protein